MKYLKIFFFVLLIILLSSLINVFNENFYNDKLRENGAYERFGDEAYLANSEVFDYFIFKEELNTDFFNEKEKKHLEDVRKLFIFGYLLFLLSLTSLLFIKKKELNDVFLKSGIIGIIFILAITLVSILSFESLFTAFHKVFFKENTWIFSLEDNIVNLYTLDLFYDLFLRILLTSLFLFILLIIFYVVKVKYQK